MLEEGRTLLELAIEIGKNDHYLLYYRGLYLLSQNEFFDALNDLNKAIQLNDESVAKYHLARGRTYACLSMFKEAIADLSIATKLDPDSLEVYYIYIYIYIVGIFK